MKWKKIYALYISLALLLATLAYLLYLKLRDFRHNIRDNIEQSHQTTTDMTISTGYDTTVRGYRNNNPLNIRLGNNHWKGEVVPSADKSFCQFQTMAYGFRAAMVCIRTYIVKYGCNTLQDIINRWAPWADGNNPTNYAKRVMARFPDTFPSSDTIIFPTDKTQMTRLVFAMAIVENGSEPRMQDCEQAFQIM